ncbi:MAG: hypothetical protein KIS87_04425 [Phycisphaeraceae bacterium]|nr:hypothetical protein [Phycisphaeraceae bacterium]
MGYSLDGRDRLTRAERGTWGGSSIGSLKQDERWTLTQTGNWDLHRLDLNGDGDFIDAGELDDRGTFNVVNELTARDIDDDTTDEFTLVYDAAGHLTDDGENYEYVYDAWGRLRFVKDTGNQSVIAKYTYNGLGYRIGWHYDVDADGTVEANTEQNSDDPWFHFVYDTRWRIVAVHRVLHWHAEGGWTFDADPKERFVYHNAGLAGGGGSSYIDAVILRDRDANTAWEDQADGTLEERVYYCQNWRADVVALFGSNGHMLQQVRYDPYGVPFGISKADLTADGVLDSADQSRFTTLYNSGSGTHPFADWNLDGTLSSLDLIAYGNSYTGDVALGYGVLDYAFSRPGGANRKAYAGYEIDPVLTGANGRESVYHVRHRVLLSELGRWNRRDPLGYVDGMSLYAYVGSAPIMASDPTGRAKIPGIGGQCEDTHGRMSAGCEADPPSLFHWTMCVMMSSFLAECYHCCDALQGEEKAACHDACRERHSDCGFWYPPGMCKDAFPSDPGQCALCCKHHMDHNKSYIECLRSNEMDNCWIDEDGNWRKPHDPELIDCLRDVTEHYDQEIEDEESHYYKVCLTTCANPRPKPIFITIVME